MPKKIPEVNYGDEAAKLLRLCREYIDGANRALAQTPLLLPDIQALSQIKSAHSGINTVRADGEDPFNLGWPFVALRVDGPDSNERTERYVDPGIFVVAQLFAYAGCKLGLFRSNYKRKNPKLWYLHYGSNEHSFRRLVVRDTQGSDVRQLPTADPREAHYDYRRATLYSKPKPEVREEGHKTRSKSKGRDDAIEFAVENLRQQHEHHHALGSTGPEMTPVEFEQLLREAFSVADKIYETSKPLHPSHASSP